jgi:hypothetical protein
MAKVQKASNPDYNSVFIYLFIYGLFNDAVSSSHYKPSVLNGKVIEQQLIGRDE